MNTEYVPPVGKGAALYVRPLAFATSATVGLSLASEFIFCVYVLPVVPLHGSNRSHRANALGVEDSDRAAPRGTGSVKMEAIMAPYWDALTARAKRSMD